MTWYGIVIVVTGVSLVAVPQLSAASGHGKSACQKLRGTDLAPARGIKLVERHTDLGDTHLVSCALPRGRVRELASSSGGSINGSSYTLRQVAGAVVLLDEGFESSGRIEETTRVVNIRTGRRYSIARLAADLTGPPQPGTHSTAPAAFINPRGKAPPARAIDHRDRVIAASASAAACRRPRRSRPVGL